MDTERLSALKLSLKDVAAMLAGEPYLAAVFTDEDVRAAQQRLLSRSLSDGIEPVSHVASHYLVRPCPPGPT